MEVDTFMLIEEGVYIYMMTTTTETNDDKLFVDVDGTITKRMQHCVCLCQEEVAFNYFDFFFFAIVKCKMLVIRCCHLPHCVIVLMDRNKVVFE